MSSVLHTLYHLTRRGFAKGKSCFLLLAFVLLIFSSSCNTFDPPLTEPMYGHIDSIHFTVTADSQGSASHSIPYAWVYLDDNPVGAFQMPCTFPMIATNGTHTIEVYPAVTPVGANLPASIDPFYQFYSISLNMQQGNTYKLKPTSTYFNWVQFPYLESFDNDGGIGNYPRYIVNYYGSSATERTNTSMVIIGGKLGYQGYSGMVVVNQQNNYYCGSTWPPKTLSSATSSNTPVYLEFNYRATAEFTVGMFELDTTVQSSPIAVVYPTATWQKMYVSLNNTIYPSFQAGGQSIYFNIVWDGVSAADTLLLDNIKILD